MSSVETGSPQTISVPERQSQLVFERLARYSTRLAKNVDPENVHRFRTNSRRVEALVAKLAPQSGHRKKALKLLSKLRKRAGKIRDLDAQIAFLKNLKTPDRQNHRSELLKTLSEERSRRAEKLTRLADPATMKELRKRLRREREGLKLDGIDPLRLAHEALPNPDQSPMSEKMLHGCRIAARVARYLAELGGEQREATVFVHELKRAQDAIGEWHDILKLKQTAEVRFGSASDSALVSVLQTLSRARFRSATHALLHALSNLRNRQRSTDSITSLQRKHSASDVATQRAAVA
jgi:CHAD domain-containing protein